MLDCGVEGNVDIKDLPAVDTQSDLLYDIFGSSHDVALCRKSDIRQEQTRKNLLDPSQICADLRAKFGKNRQKVTYFLHLCSVFTKLDVAYKARSRADPMFATP